MIAENVDVRPSECAYSRPARVDTLRPETNYLHVMLGGSHAYRHVTLSHVSFWRQAVGGDNVPVVPVSV